MVGRIIFDAVLFLIIVFSYWWAAAAVALLGLFIFKNYYEIIIVGILLDVLYGIGTVEPHYSQFKFTIASVISYAASIPIKRTTRFY